jgi:predicted transposase YbfD/YdcC
MCTCHSCSHPGWILGCGKEWPGIKSFDTITSQRTILATGETAAETRCFISSLEKDTLNQLNIIRKHGKIENNLHGRLDVSFKEDDTKMKKNQLPNIAALRKMAMPVLKAFTYKKGYQ